MIEEFAKTPYQTTHQHDYHLSDVIKYLKGRIDSGFSMLDIGAKSPLTVKIAGTFPDLTIENTDGDLDTILIKERKTYGYILYSHTIEHQFNPLHTLLQLRNVMDPDTKMFIILPRRGKLLWDKGHYHEIDHYRMKLLLQRAGYDIISFELHKGWRHWWFYLTGIRPLLRLFFEYNAYYEVKLNS